ncbi:SDR family NAD(P)-dependent oxidoreductase [Parapusillimonas granuli]|uniref:SDR family oxidoreductase n=1 Tax=Parapusillimonas granuli TaxID=380911 RepID=A0A853FWC8_9BURK|nr:SDR family NAD(P)-dependent oxidoreductase [Parapusillimonas granuli]MBB5216929.1 3-oxoacyl-[acyl-carrier protein] reductase [Parapusillimonas granuli]MEB2400739.1 SDR family NAD(P)-dependent oxidoreductase [Alcaligenaceae bacterium]NYT50305.1 SDR family oxidoreductase [Parapusillimonas granuli]
MKPVAIVTGGARNIGWAIARRLAADYRVLIADLSEPQQPLPDGCGYFHADVCDPQQVRKLFAEAEKLGPLQLLVHSAAVTAPARPIASIPLEEWRRLIDINLTGSFVVAQAAITPLLKTKGSMVLLTSRAGKTGFAALNAGKAGTKAHYCASKAGVISLMKSLATELSPDIRVNAVAPGPIEGEMIPRDRWPEIAARVPLGRLGTAAEIADAVHFLASPAASFITGHVLDVNGGTLMD